MSDFDIMELIAFNSKVRREGFRYAFEHYGPRFEDRDLRQLAADERRLRTFYREHRRHIEDWWNAHPEDGCDLHNAHVARKSPGVSV